MQSCEHDWMIIEIKCTLPIGIRFKCINCGVEFLMEPNDKDVYNEPKDTEVHEGEELRQ